jgi:hypothetical protein
MADEKGAPTPGTALSRGALERVIARAAELQAASGDADEAGAMNEAQLLELGREVGLSADALRQALAEERSRTLVPEESGVAGVFTGPASVTAARTVNGAPGQVLAAVDEMMQRDEALQVKRRFTDQLVWESRRDVFSALRRGLKLGGRAFELTGANDVSAMATSAGPNRTHVRLAADFRETRERRAKGAVAGVIAFLLAGAPLFIIGVPPWLAVVPPLLLSAATLSLTRRNYRRMLTRAMVALEQALDRLEFADARRPSPAQAILDALVTPPRLPKG